MERLFKIAPKYSGNSSGQVEVDVVSLEGDPAKRKPIGQFHPDSRESIRRQYLVAGPRQPTDIVFPYTKNGDFTKNGRDRFVGSENGFQGWNHGTHGLNQHANNECHKLCVLKCRDLMNSKKSIKTSMKNSIEYLDKEYAFKVKTYVQAVKLLLRGGQAFRGRDEKDRSSYMGHFLEYVKELRETQNVTDFHTMSCPNIQKEIALVAAYLTSSTIANEIGDEEFAVLVDESGDCSFKEQMALVVRFVDSRGCIVERFLGIAHVKETSVPSLKEALLDILNPNGLSLSKIRGQGYDGASNMSGRLNRLKALILNENPVAFFVHYFAHRLQLALVATVKCHLDMSAFLGQVTSIVNIIGSSNKRQELLRGEQLTHYVK